MQAAVIAGLIIDGIAEGVEGVRKVIADLQQRGELNEQEAADLTQRMETSFASSAWQQDKPDAGQP